MTIEEIIKRSQEMGLDRVNENNIDEEIIKVCSKVYEKYGENVWIPGIDIIEELKSLGKANVRNHLGKLVDSGILKDGLHETRLVYQWVPGDIRK